MKKSKFNLSHMHSTTLDAGYLVPFACIPTLPNDTFFIGNKSFVRATPMLAPLMHRVFLFTQYWYVPYRLLWENWEEAITGGEFGNAAPTFPTIKADTTSGFAVGSLADYLGFPVNQPGIEVSAFPFRAMAEIWNTRYRDEDLQSEVAVSYADGLDTVTNTLLLSPCWKRDKFTKSRLSTQRGGEISVPINPSVTGGEQQFYHYVFTAYFKRQDTGAYLTVWEGLGTSCPTFDNSALQKFISDNLSSLTSADVGFEVDTGIDYDLKTSNTTSFPADIIIRVTSKELETYTNQPLSQFISTASVTCAVLAGRAVQQKIFGAVYHSALLSSSGSLDIRDLRLASALQRYQERSLKWGNRYEEMIMREFGVRPRDARIDRPEYLGGGKSMLSISEVLQTAEGTDTGVGTMRGHGVGSLKNRRIKFKSPEHGVILGLVSIRPEPVYTQGIDKEWLKRSRLDFYTPELADVGMQEIMQQEIYATADNASTIFGYTEKYQEYRYMPPKVTGEFRTGNYNFWNMARVFANPPSLSGEFVSMSSSVDSFKRPFAERTQHSYLLMLRNEILAYRAISKRARNILK